MRSPVVTTSPFATGWKGSVRSAVLGGAAKLGMRLERLEDTASFVDDDSTLAPQMQADAVSIPGMVGLRRGMYYYCLAYAGQPGDIIELGCWQGRSTSFLARACKDAGNGVVHAVDTFSGNPGNEAAYRVDKEDLSDLRSGFESNMSQLGLGDHVRVHDGDSSKLAPEVLSQVEHLRMLVIDAEHTYDAVRAELEAYAPAVDVGGLMVFDDYSKSFPGVARAIQEYLGAHPIYSRPMQDEGLLLVRRVR